MFLYLFVHAVVVFAHVHHFTFVFNLKLRKRGEPNRFDFELSIYILLMLSLVSTLMFYISSVLFIVISCLWFKPFILSVVFASLHNFDEVWHWLLCSPTQCRMFLLCNSIEWTEMSTVFVVTVHFEAQAEGNLMYGFLHKVSKHFLLGLSGYTVLQEFSNNLFLIFRPRSLKKVLFGLIDAQKLD